MTSLGLRPRVPLPRNYKGARLIQTHGRVYAIPAFLDPQQIRELRELLTHPATFSAPTRPQLESLIDAFDAGPYQPVPVGRRDGYNLVRHGDRIYGVPESAGRVDLNLEEQRRRAAFVCGTSPDEVEECLRDLDSRVPVEFAGWLPIYEYSANCGKHPQFNHTADPPPGYRFTYSAPSKTAPSWWDKTLGRLGRGIGWLAAKTWAAVRMTAALFFGGPRVGVRTRLRVILAAVRLFFRLQRGGGRLLPVLRFLKTRHYASQLLLGKQRSPVFLPSMPYTYNQNPWVIEIEDPITLFNPHVQNGVTCGVRIEQSPYLPIVRTLLESEQCKGIITHMRSTARMVRTLFGSDTISAKVFYAPLGAKLPESWQRHEDKDTDDIHLIFINSWNQSEGNFYLRGGLDILEAYAILRERYPQLRLTLRTTLPDLDKRYHRIIEEGWVRVIDRVLSPEEMDQLLTSSHIFLLPAARVHIVSLLQAMSYGLAVVTSDGWGIEEYVTHERNGLIVKGRYGKVSWVDEQAGFLREDYEPICTADPEVIAGLVEAISRLVEDRELRRRLGHNARHDVENTYNLENWNRGLKEALDKALAR